MFRPCQDFEVDAPVGFMCNRVCKKEKVFGSDCKEWKVIVKDMTNEQDFKFFRDAAYVCIPEEMLL